MSHLRIKLESAHPLRQNCFVCGLSERPSDIDTFAYVDGESAGWVCYECRKLNPAAIKGKLLERARGWREYAEELEDVAKGDITLPTEKEFAEAVKMAEKGGVERGYDMKAEFLREFGHLVAGHGEADILRDFGLEAAEEAWAQEALAGRPDTPWSEEPLAELPDGFWSNPPVKEGTLPDFDPRNRGQLPAFKVLTADELEAEE
jgi:hypothetical protein